MIASHHCIFQKKVVTSPLYQKKINCKAVNFREGKGQQFIFQHGEGVTIDFLFWRRSNVPIRPSTVMALLSRMVLPTTETNFVPINFFLLHEVSQGTYSYNKL